MKCFTETFKQRVLKIADNWDIVTNALNDNNIDGIGYYLSEQIHNIDFKLVGECLESGNMELLKKEYERQKEVRSLFKEWKEEYS